MYVNCLKAVPLFIYRWFCIICALHLLLLRLLFLLQCLLRSSLYFFLRFTSLSIGFNTAARFGAIEKCSVLLSNSKFKKNYNDVTLNLLWILWCVVNLSFSESFIGCEHWMISFLLANSLYGTKCGCCCCYHRIVSQFTCIALYIVFFSHVFLWYFEQ